MLPTVVLEIHRVTELSSVFEYNCYVSRKQNLFVNRKRRQHYKQAATKRNVIVLPS